MRERKELNDPGDGALRRRRGSAALKQGRSCPLLSRSTGPDRFVQNQYTIFKICKDKDSGVQHTRPGAILIWLRLCVERLSRGGKAHQGYQTGCWSAAPSPAGAPMGSCITVDLDSSQRTLEPPSSIRLRLGAEAERQASRSVRGTGVGPGERLIAGASTRRPSSAGMHSPRSAAGLHHFFFPMCHSGGDSSPRSRRNPCTSHRSRRARQQVHILCYCEASSVSTTTTDDSAHGPRTRKPNMRV
jgi:hypothetical protein